jgi:hypothetical protein
MTKAFLERISLKPENEQLILEAFSKKSLKKVKEFDAKRATKLRKTSDRKLSINDLAKLTRDYCILYNHD